MNKDIKDYLHLYLGCDTLPTYATETRRLISVNVDNGNSLLEDKQFNSCTYAINEFKLLLRPLSDMSEEELKEVKHIMLEYQNLRFKCDEKDRIKYTNVFIYDIIDEDGYHHSTMISSPENLPAKVVPWMCRHGFDIFDLCRAGLAIDKTKMK